METEPVVRGGHHNEYDGERRREVQEVICTNLSAATIRTELRYSSPRGRLLQSFLI